jgi:hypothetical protein
MYALLGTFASYSVNVLVPKCLISGRKAPKWPADPGIIDLGMEIGNFPQRK